MSLKYCVKKVSTMLFAITLHDNATLHTKKKIHLFAKVDIATIATSPKAFTKMTLQKF